MTYPPLTLTLTSPLLAREWRFHLEPLAAMAARSHLTLVLDAPRGAAWHLLQTSPPGAVARSLVVTDLGTPEYLDDLWDLGPALLALNVQDVTQLTMLVEQVVRTGRVRWGAPTSPLTPGERRVLQLVALGHSNKRIAAALDLSERTVQNVLSRVFEKLNLSGRTEAALYYWGQGERSHLDRELTP